MKCRLCGKTLKLKEYKKHVCEQCLNRVPKCMHDGIGKMDLLEAKYLISKFHPREKLPNPEQHMWIRYNDVGLTTKGIIIENRFMILYEDIGNYFFDFLPREYISPGKAKGEFCFVFQLKGFPYKFRTLAACRTADYKIIDGIISPTFHQDIHRMVIFIQQGIRSKTHDLTEEQKKYEEERDRERTASYQKAREEEERRQEEERRRKEEQERTYSWRWEEEKFRQQSQQNRQQQNRQQQNRQQQNRQQNASGDELKVALAYFHMNMPYTNEELKKVYRTLILQCHPDQKIRRSDLQPEDVNRYYGILKRYAS